MFGVDWLDSSCALADCINAASLRMCSIRIASDQREVLYAQRDDRSASRSAEVAVVQEARTTNAAWMLCALVIGCADGRTPTDDEASAGGAWIDTAGAGETGGTAASGGTSGFGGAAGVGGAAGMAGASGLGGDGGFGGEAGAGGLMPGGAGGDGAGTGGTTVQAAACVDGSTEVVWIGDSYVNYGAHTLPADMQAISGQTWPLYAVPGASMATGGLLGFIPDQFEMAIAAYPSIKVVVMSGGGNDILLPDAFAFPRGAECNEVLDSPSIPDCQAIVAAALDTMDELWGRMAAAGVEDVVYFFYPHIPGGGLLGGAHPNAILDYALPQARALCEEVQAKTGGQLRCHFVDLVPAFEGRVGLFGDASNPAGDGVHPNSMGSNVVAQTVWDLMEQRCVGQTASNACCTR